MRATEEQLRQLTDSIVRQIKPDRVILFGSQVRGTTTDDSDIDLLVVDSRPHSPTRSRRKLIGEVRRNLPRVGIPIDLLLYDKQEFDYWRNTTNHIIAEAAREGRVLHEAAHD